MRRAILLITLLAAACGGTSNSGPKDADSGSAPDVPMADVQYGDGVPDTAADPGSLGDLPEDGASDPGGFLYPCEPLTVEACDTACGTQGKRKCLKDWGPCIPPVESCETCLDDNCDGQINENCPVDSCNPPKPECPIAQITVAEGSDLWTKDTLHLSAKASSAKDGTIVQWLWSVTTPAGSAASFKPSSAVEEPTLALDVAGDYLLALDVWDDKGTKSCSAAQVALVVKTYPPQDPQVGCADGSREGFLELATYPQIAGCSGAWDKPGITPDSVAPTCGRKGGNTGSAITTGAGCSSADLCADGWHVCKGWQEVAQKSTTGCAGATPPGAKEKSLFFAIRQPSSSGSVCGAWGDGDNDVFGCGNLGGGMGGDKNCGPLDRVLASTQANKCGFNEAEPNLGPWECLGDATSHLHEGAVVTKKGCQGGSCSYDGYPVGPTDKGGVLCCRDPAP